MSEKSEQGTASCPIDLTNDDSLERVNPKRIKLEKGNHEKNDKGNSEKIDNAGIGEKNEKGNGNKNDKGNDDSNDIADIKKRLIVLEAALYASQVYTKQMDKVVSENGEINARLLKVESWQANYDEENKPRASTQYPPVPCTRYSPAESMHTSVMSNASSATSAESQEDSQQGFLKCPIHDGVIREKATQTTMFSVAQQRFPVEQDSSDESASSEIESILQSCKNLGEEDINNQVDSTQNSIPLMASNEDNIPFMDSNEDNIPPIDSNEDNIPPMDSNEDNIRPSIDLNEAAPLE